MRPRAAFAFQMLLGGVAILVLPRLADVDVVRSIFAPLRTLGYVMTLIGMGLTLMVLLTWAFRSASSDETADIEDGGVGATTISSDRGSATDHVVDRTYPAPSTSPPALPTAADVERLLDVIEWQRFEALVACCFRLNGYTTSSQSHGADGGVDIRLYAEHDPDTVIGAVQCKHWGTRRVGVEAVRALRGSMVALGVDKGYLATSSTCTPDAVEFATHNQIELVDRHRLVTMILGYTAEQRTDLMQTAMQGRYDVPTCASCGIKMIRRQPRLGGPAFWGCANYPRCRSVIRIRTQR